MNIVEKIYNLFNNFQDEGCRAFNGYDPELCSSWNDYVEGELDLIRKHSPIQLPEDYCDIFRAFVVVQLKMRETTISFLQ